jgi:hypothetical protein
LATKFTGAELSAMNKHLLLALVLTATVNLPGNAQGTNKLGLPPTSMDSFVRQAAGNADLIYGDEGVVDIPPYDYFDPIHRINAGIFDTRRKGLTTGHGSYLPDAWGGDEWTGNEWSMSGPGNGGNPTTTPNIVQDQPSQGDPASNDPAMNPTSQPLSSPVRAAPIGPGGSGITGTVTTSPSQNNPRQFSQ